MKEKQHYRHLDELHHLKIFYSPEEIKKMWEECFPKISKSHKKPIITKTPEVNLKLKSKKVEAGVIHVPWMYITTPYITISDKDGTHKVWIKSKRKICMYYAYQITRIKWFLIQYAKDK